MSAARAPLTLPPRDAVAWFLFSSYIVMLVLLPSGTVHGIPLKMIVFVPLVGAAFVRLLRSPEGLWQAAFISLAGSVLAAWTAISLTNPFFSDYSVLQCKDITTTLLGCLMIRLFADTPERQLRFIKLCLLTVAIGSLLKVGLLTYALAKGQSVSDYVDRISAIFGVKLMTIDLEGAGGRLQFPSDNLIPLCIYAMLTTRKRINLHALTAVVIFLALLVSSLYTFSRFIWLSTVLAVLLGFMVGRKDRLTLFYAGSAGAVIIATLPILLTLVGLRFASTVATASDSDRTVQLPALQAFVASAPLFGHGFGSYVLQLKRSKELPYAYEIQLLALLGQCGIIGLSMLGLLLVNYYKKAFHFNRGSRLAQVAVALLLMDLLAAGMFNPSLIVSMASVGYGMIFVQAKLASFEGNRLLPLRTGAV